VAAPALCGFNLLFAAQGLQCCLGVKQKVRRKAHSSAAGIVLAWPPNLAQGNPWTLT